MHHGGERNGISQAELFCLLVLFLLGSAWLLGLGTQAKEDAWLADLIGLLLGLPLVGLYLLLQRLLPGQTLIDWLQAVFGRWLGRLLGLVYIGYFLYIAARVTRDFGGLTVTAILPQTPISVVILVQLGLVCYGVRHGPEVIGRAALFLMPAAVLVVLISTLLTARDFRLTNLQPILGQGWGPVLDAAWPLAVTVPYGETVLFGMIWPRVDGPVGRVTAGAALAGGFFLVFLTLVEIAVLGSHIVATSQFPLLELVRQINVADILDRMDSAIVLALILGGFMKVSLFLYGVAAGTARWLGLKEYRPLVLPLGGIVAALSFLQADSYPEHLYIGLRKVPYLLHIPLQILLPGLMLMVQLARIWLRRSRTRARTP